MKCKRCDGELTRDEKRGCWVCLNCYPPNSKPVTIPKKDVTYIDVKPDEKRVIELIKEQEDWIRTIIQDELENWYIQKPSVDKSSVESTLETAKDEDWRKKAKELGISMFHKTKEEVLKEIEEKSADADSENSQRVDVA